jgi:hypothetical protein
VLQIRVVLDAPRLSPDRPALPAPPRQQVNKEQNKSSRQIYNQKHNNKTDSPARDR